MKLLARKKIVKHFPWERIYVIASTLAIWGLLAYFLFFLQIKNQLGDTAFVAQVLYNFKHTLQMQTTYYTSTTESIDHVWYKLATEVCAMDLESKFTNTPWGHHYFIAYLLIPIARVMDIPVMLAMLHAGIYTSVLLFAYLLARQKKLSIPLAILFTILVMHHPLWNQGLIGQFYFNRFFLPFCGFLILFLEKKKLKYALIFLICALAASTNEIYGITIFIVLMSYMWIYRKVDRTLLFFAGLLLVFGFVSTAYIQQHFPLRSTQTNTLGYLFGYGFYGMVQTIWMNVIDVKTQVFLMINMLAMGVFAFFDLWLILPLFIVLVPNILVNLGGAEKIGWSTHYHIGYFIPLIWISLVGLSRMNDRPKLQTAFIGISLVFMIWVNPVTLQLNERPNIVIKRLIQSMQYHIQLDKIDLEFRRKLREAVGEGTTLSVPEAISYTLYDHTMYYYPMGIDTVNVVVLKFDETKTGDQRFSSINYGHQDPNLDLCIFERMKKGGFDFDNPTIVNNWVVIRRKTVQ